MRRRRRATSGGPASSIRATRRGVSSTPSCFCPSEGMEEAISEAKAGRDSRAALARPERQRRAMRCTLRAATTRPSSGAGRPSPWIRISCAPATILGMALRAEEDVPGGHRRAREARRLSERRTLLCRLASVTPTPPRGGPPDARRCLEDLNEMARRRFVGSDADRPRPPRPRRAGELRSTLLEKAEEERGCRGDEHRIRSRAGTRFAPTRGFSNS